MSVDDEERRHSATRLAASPLFRRAQSSKEISGSRRMRYHFAMEKTSRKEHKWKRSRVRNARKTRTRLELGPKVAVNFSLGLDVFFVDMIVREYLEGLFSKRRASYLSK